MTDKVLYKAQMLLIGLVSRKTKLMNYCKLLRTNNRFAYTLKAYSKIKNAD